MTMACHFQYNPITGDLDMVDDDNESESFDATLEPHGGQSFILKLSKT